MGYIVQKFIKTQLIAIEFECFVHIANGKRVNEWMSEEQLVELVETECMVCSLCIEEEKTHQQKRLWNRVIRWIVESTKYLQRARNVNKKNLTNISYKNWNKVARAREENSRTKTTTTIAQNNKCI